MKVLIACEFSGRVRDAFIKKGHDAVSCDLLPTESPGPHYQGNVFDIIKKDWDLMIAHPPCTYLSYAANRVWNAPGRRQKREQAMKFFLELVNSDIPRKAIENPVGYPNTVFRKPDQIIHPYYFGDPVKKRMPMAGKPSRSRSYRRKHPVHDQNPYKTAARVHFILRKEHSFHRSRHRKTGHQNQIQNIPRHCPGHVRTMGVNMQINRIPSECPALTSSCVRRSASALVPLPVLRLKTPCPGSCTPLNGSPDILRIPPHDGCPAILTALKGPAPAPGPGHIPPCQPNSVRPTPGCFAVACNPCSPAGGPERPRLAPERPHRTGPQGPVPFTFKGDSQ